MKFRKNIKLPIVVLVMSMLGLSLIKDVHCQPSNLALVNSFPSSDDDVFIRKPLNMSFDESNNVYISDHLGSKILKFTKDGDFIKHIGRRGKGPGEFGNVREIRVQDSLLVAYNESKIQMYDTNGSFLDMYYIFGVQNFWLTNHHIYVHKIDKDPRVLLEENGTDLKLIKIFDLKGNSMGSFGELLKGLPFKNSYQKIMGSSLMFREYDHKLYVLFRYFPILRIYDLKSHELINEINLTHTEEYKERVAQNYEADSYSQKGTMRLRFLFNAFDVNSNGIYVGLYDDNILIDHYDFNGKFKNSYIKNYDVTPYYLYDLKVFANNEINDTLIYTLSRKDNVPIVEAFTLLNENSR